MSNCAKCGAVTTTHLTTLRYQQCGTVVVVQQVPVEHCDACGGRTTPRDVDAKVEAWLAEALQSGERLVVRSYVPDAPAPES